MEETTKKIYLAIKDNEVVWYPDLEVLKTVFKVSDFDMVITEEEYLEADGLIRLIDGKIVLGETDTEKNLRAAKDRIKALKNQLTDTDYVACKIAEDPDCKERYAEILKNRKDWRTEISNLQANTIKWESELAQN